MKSIDIGDGVGGRGALYRKSCAERYDCMKRCKCMKRYNDMKRYIYTCILIASLSLVQFGCGTPEGGGVQANDVEQAAVAPGGQGDSRETVLGPVRAVVNLSHRAPVLGEQITLSLTVEAEPDVVVSMPEFGDQLGRFGIADYKATETVSETGHNVYVQSYTLDLPMSGSLRTPSFLVEFTDNRASSEKKGVVQEILTEEMTFEVGSVFGDGRVPEELSPAIGNLPELVMPSGEKSPWWMYAGMVALVAALLGGIYALRRKSSEPGLAVDEVALRALQALEKRGLPSNQSGADRWYVELSSILRTYIEGRFGVDAPRLTTEEFFEQAKKSAELVDDDKRLIRKLLERSDRVKFTDFMPTTEEMEQMLVDSRRFVEETRVVAVEEAKKDA